MCYGSANNGKTYLPTLEISKGKWFINVVIFKRFTQMRPASPKTNLAKLDSMPKYNIRDFSIML